MYKWRRGQVNECLLGGSRAIDRVNAGHTYPERDEEATGGFTNGFVSGFEGQIIYCLPSAWRMASSELGEKVWKYEAVSGQL